LGVEDGLRMEVDGEEEEGRGVLEGDAEREERDDGDDDDEEEREEEGETYGTQEEVLLGQDLPVDEVGAVMENLDDFLGGNWDVDADLAKARAEQEQESRGGGGGGYGMTGSDGLLDVGVWD
jgi:hypothetical protein